MKEVYFARHKFRDYPENLFKRTNVLQKRGLVQFWLLEKFYRYLILITYIQIFLTLGTLFSMHYIFKKLIKGFFIKFCVAKFRVNLNFAIIFWNHEN